MHLRNYRAVEFGLGRRTGDGVTAVESSVDDRFTDAAGALGFHRLDFVRISIWEDEIQAEAVGVVHRLPRDVTVPLALATRLVSSGVPLVLRDFRPQVRQDRVSKAHRRSRVSSSAG